MSLRGKIILSIAISGIALLTADAAYGQVGFGQPGSGLGQPGVGGPPGGGKKKPPPKNPATGEETHAATTGDDVNHLPTQEPSLPPNPTEIPKAIKDRIGTDDHDEIETGKGTKESHFFFPPYYSEQSGQYRFRTVFPLWAERTQPNDRASLFGFYYNRRSKDVDSDVLFPLFWKLRDHQTYTTIVGPWMHREAAATPKSPGRHDNWLAPLYFEGESTDGSGYFHVPLLATFTQHTASSGFNLAGPLFCKWKGGPACDSRTADDIDLGVAPLYFYGRNEGSEYEIIPPLLHYYKFSDVGDSSFNLWGPLLWEHSRDSQVFNVMPIFWHNWGKNEDHLTVFPLFHYGYKGNSNLFINPLFVTATGDNGESTFATYLYAHYKGRTELSMYTPLVWHYEDPDIGLERTLVFPFYYSNSSPRSNDLALFPLYGHFKKPGLSESTWVTPLFRTATDVTGWETDLFPAFYIGRHYNSTHLVLAPFFWDFATPHSRATVVLPAYYRFADDTTVSQVALNTYYHEKKVSGGTEWEFHLFPVFSYGESPNGHWWNVLYGMAGYTREGTAAKVRAFYIPIKLSE